MIRIKGIDSPPDEVRLPVTEARMIHWFASLPLSMVATHPRLAGLVLSAAEAAGWNDWGHDALLLALFPIVAWLIARWFVGLE